jgi:hypothetical protein
MRLHAGAHHDRPMMSTALSSGHPGRLRRGGGVGALYDGLRRRGLSREEAGNFVGRAVGVGPIRGGWTPAELERLLFLRWLVATGRIAG